MKKLIAIIILLTLTQFRISIEPREVSASTIYESPAIPTGGVVSSTVYSDNMDYRVFTYDHKSGYPGGIYVINVTKDRLEVERLELEIARLKKLK
jgi:hypothetical protein